MRDGDALVSYEKGVFIIPLILLRIVAVSFDDCLEVLP